MKGLFHEIAGHHGFEIEELEVDKDHVHLFVSFPPKHSIGQVVGLFKAVSVKEIREEFPEVRKHLWGGEFWEDGIFCADGGRQSDRRRDHEVHSVSCGEKDRG